MKEPLFQGGRRGFLHLFFFRAEQCAQGFPLDLVGIDAVLDLDLPPNQGKLAVVVEVVERAHILVIEDLLFTVVLVLHSLFYPKTPC